MTCKLGHIDAKIGCTDCINQAMNIITPLLQTGHIPHFKIFRSKPSEKTQEENSNTPVQGTVGMKWSERYAKKSSKEKVWYQLSKSFYEKDMGWIKNAHWIGPVEVPLDRVNFSTENTWTARKEPELVKSKVKKIKKGKRKPVVLIDAPKNNKYFILDGHHRALAYKELDIPITAFIGKVSKEKGPWDTFHNKQKPKDPEAKL